MKIFLVKNKKIIESDTEEFNYRECVSTPMGVMPKIFFENGQVKYWAGDKVKVINISTVEEHARRWQKILRFEFENWAENDGDLDYYYDLEAAQKRIKELIDEECNEK